jgi:uncharacterized protein (DUF1499 family)
MKRLCKILVSSVVLYGAFFGILSYLATKKRATSGMIDGRLGPCSDTPNCVCSEYPGFPAYIAPLAFNVAPAVAWARIREAVVALDGRIEESSDRYLWATFRTTLFRFTDDVELRLEADKNVIQVRSVSRVGKGDFGVNRERVERLRALFDRLQHQ